MSSLDGELPEITRKHKLSRIATFFAFFQMGAVMLMWSTSTTSLRNLLGWEEGDGDTSFGTLAFSIGLGFAIGCAISGPMIDRWGCRNVAIPSLVLYPILYLPLTFLDGMTELVATGVLIGIMRGFVDIVANVNGVQLERYYGRPIMSAFHAAYPAAGFIFGIVGSAFAREFTESPLVPYLVIGITMAILGYLFGRLYLERDEYLPQSEIRTGEVNAEDDSKGKQVKWGILAVMFGFGVLAFVSYLAEGATFDWGQEFVRRTLDTTAGLAAMALTVFSGAQFVGRMMGDKLTHWFGQGWVMAGSGIVGASGAGLMITAVSPLQALIGFGLIGLGVSCIVPLMLSAAGRMDPNNSGLNIGLVNAIGTSGMFIGPAAITAVVAGLGIEWMPLLPLVLLLSIAIAGPILMKAAPSFKSERQAEPVKELVSKT